VDRLNDSHTNASPDHYSAADVTFLFFTSFVLAVAIAIIFMFFRHGDGGLLLLATTAGVCLWVSERLATSPSSDSTHGPACRPGMLWLLILIVVWGVCYPTMKGSFLEDDFVYLHLFDSRAFGDLLPLFYSDASQGLWGYTVQELRPVHGFLYKSLYSGFALNPTGYHAVALSLHCLNAMLVFLIARFIDPEKSWRAIFAGLLFALLPSQSETISWINGSLTESPFTFFYLLAFLCFAVYRQTCRKRYLMVCIAAYIGCLLSKESSVTLPVMLFAYDVFLFFDPQPYSRPRRTARIIPIAAGHLRAYLPFAVLLILYLGSRLLAFGNVLRESQWNALFTSTSSDASNLFTGISGLARGFVAIYGLILRQAWLPFTGWMLVCVLAVFISWTISLLTDVAACRGTAMRVTFFAAVWTVITTAPVVVAQFGPSARHVYLSTAGQCIAVSLLAFPICRAGRTRSLRLRVAGALLIVCASAVRLKKENAVWVNRGRSTAAGVVQLTSDLQNLGHSKFVMVRSYGWGWIFPYALQRPFSAQDLYSPARIIEPLERYCCPLPQWWGKTKALLTAEITGSPDEMRTLYLLDWDDRTNIFNESSRRVTRQQLQTYLWTVLKAPLQSAKLADEAQANDFFNGLADFIAEAEPNHSPPSAPHSD
jgi:hypothetical protein